jgi:hypothetical protein
MVECLWLKAVTRELAQATRLVSVMGFFSSVVGFVGGVADGVVDKIAPGATVSMDFIVYISAGSGDAKESLLFIGKIVQQL